MRVLIVGGSDAGISAALRIHELDPWVEVTVLLADAYPNYSICGLPFFLSGETPVWRSLAHRTEFPGIELLRDHLLTRLDIDAKSAEAQTDTGAKILAYDRLIVATGAVSVRTKLPGVDLPGVHLLHYMGDAFAIHRSLTQDPAPSFAVIIGAGYIGIEMADALTVRGLHVTLVSRTDPVFPTVDPAFGARIGTELSRHGVDVLAGDEVSGIERDGPRLAVLLSSGQRLRTELVLVATGTRPDTGLAVDAGAATGERGAIQVDRQMRTTLADGHAAGDCVETWHRVLGRPTWTPLGTTAHKQGRVAGENAIGGRAIFGGSVGTQAVKVFDLAVARTGLLEREAKAAGFDAATSELTMSDHKAYYPGAQELRLRVVGDRRTRRLLGAQILGSAKSEVSKRIDVFATALFHEMSVERMNDLDLSYTPPLSSLWDPVQVAAQAWVMAHTGP